VSARTREGGGGGGLMGQGGHFPNSGGKGAIFRDFVRTSFMDGPLIIKH